MMQGLSCEECAPGYTKTRSGLYLGTCEPCSCNGKSSTCDPDDGVCLVGSGVDKIRPVIGIFF